MPQYRGPGCDWMGEVMKPINCINTRITVALGIWKHFNRHAQTCGPSIFGMIGSGTWSSFDPVVLNWRHCLRETNSPLTFTVPITFKMTANASNIVFDDIFTISAIDKERKKFDRGSYNNMSTNFVDQSIVTPSITTIRTLKKLWYGSDPRL